MKLAGKIAGRYTFLDMFIVKFADLYTVKLAPLIALLAGLWYAGDKRARTAAVCAVTSMVVAIAIGRLMQDILPMRVRPIHSGNPWYVLPIGADQDVLEDWSSLPSDHAIMLFALATSIWLYSRRLGLLFYGWSVLFGCLPRMYAGYHYASDVIVGALIGVVVALCVERFAPVGKLAGTVERLGSRNSFLFAAAVFGLLFQFATMFSEIRVAGSSLLRIVRHGRPHIGAGHGASHIEPLPADNVLPKSTSE
jgi:undecaprenyl-diphosphatase